MQSLRGVQKEVDALTTGIRTLMRQIESELETVEDESGAALATATWRALYDCHQTIGKALEQSTHAQSIDSLFDRNRKPPSDWGA